jgi:cobalt-zinc-cadmium efflux system protein
LLKESGFQNVTIEVDEDLATHRAHKRNIEELEVENEQGHHH